MIYEIYLPLKPIPKGRPRFTRFGHAYTPQKTLQSEREIQFLLNAWKNKNGFDLIADQPIKIELTFGFQVPGSFSNKKKIQLLDQPVIKKPDLDNLIKQVLDSMNNLIFKDDNLIYCLSAEKMYSKEDFIKIKIILD